MKLALRSISLFAAAMSFAAFAAHADPVDVTFEGITYDLNLTTTDTATAGQLESQVWYGNEGAAIAFSNAVGDALGFQSGSDTFAGGTFGAFFAYELDPYVQATSYFSPYDGTGVTGLFPLDEMTGTFVIATPDGSGSVPDGGATVALLGAGMIGLLVLRRKFVARS